MKKIILLSATLLCCVFMLVSFSSKKKITSIAAFPKAADIINCLPSGAPVFLTAAAFKAKYEAPFPLRVRKNIDALTAPEINAIKVGILKMRALPYTNPTSWLYQSAIHGTTMTDDLLSWNMCHRTGEGNFFFAWHRMYVYFFERILRSKSGRADLTIPYWNCQTSPALPLAYRDKSPGNPLYDATRNANINNGATLPSSISTAFNNSLDLIPYYTFQTNLSGGPHGSVHTTVAGNMAVVTTAAKDPLFWVYHSNIDRLWEEWLSKCGGRATPVDTTWMNKTYTFFDETGTAVSLKGSDIVQIANQLYYKYDNLDPNATCGGAAFSSKLVSTESLLTKAGSVDLSGQQQSTSFSQESTTQLDSFIKTNNTSNFKFTGTGETQRLVILFSGITIDKLPEGGIEVYLNLPTGMNRSGINKYFVGLLDLFSAQHQAMHGSHGMKESDEIELDATRVAQTLGLKLTDLKKAEVSFIVRGSTLNGAEVKTDAQISIKHIKFAVEKFKK